MDQARQSTSAQAEGSPWADGRLRALCAAQVINAFGDLLTFLALPMLVYEATGSTALLALTVFVRGIPMMLASPIAGVLADRCDRRRVLVWSCLGSAALTLPPALVGTDHLMATVLATVPLKSVISALFQPAMDGVLPALVPRDRRLAVNAVFSTSFQATFFLAPLAGAALAMHVGLRSLLLVDAITFLVAAALLDRLALPPSGAPKAALDWRGFKRDLAEGVAHLRSSRVLVVLLAVAVITQLGQGFITPAWLPYVVDVLHRPAAGFGILVSVQGLGFLLGSLSLVLVGARAHSAPKRLYATFLAASGTAILMQVTTGSFGIFLAWACLVGILGAVRNVLSTTLLQQEVPVALMGRVSSSMRLLGQGAQMLAVLATGLAGDLIPPATLFLIACLVWFLGCAGGAILILLPSRRSAPEPA